MDDLRVANPLGDLTTKVSTRISAQMSLPPFNPDATCPKCGHDKIHTKYSDGQTSSWRGGCFECPYERRGEHLDRRCEQCSYRWSEAVLDAPATEARAGEDA